MHRMVYSKALPSRRSIGPAPKEQPLLYSFQPATALLWVRCKQYPSLRVYLSQSSSASTAWLSTNNVTPSTPSSIQLKHRLHSSRKNKMQVKNPWTTSLVSKTSTPSGTSSLYVRVLTGLDSASHACVLSTLCTRRRSKSPSITPPWCASLCWLDSSSKHFWLLSSYG